MNCNPPASPVHEILQARILEQVAISFSRGPSRLRDWTCVSYVSRTGRQVLYHSHRLGWQTPVCFCCSIVSRVWLFCDPMDCSPPGSSVQGISQARTLEWVAISFSSVLYSNVYMLISDSKCIPHRFDNHVCFLCLKVCFCFVSKFICVTFLDSTCSHVIWYLSFCAWLSSLSMIISRFIVWLQMALSHSFYHWVVFHCIYTTRSLYLSVSGHSGCFYVLAIVNSATVNTALPVYFQIMVLSRYVSRNGIMW